MSRPRWHATARYVGNDPWVPFEIADALQRQVDALAGRGAEMEEERAAEQARLRSASVEIEALREAVEELREEGAGWKARAEDLEVALAESQISTPSLAELPPDNDSGALERAEAALRELKGDLDRARRQRDEAFEKGRLEERIERLSSIAEIHDALRRSIESAAADGPWVEGQRALIALLEDELRRADAEFFGIEGDSFDPEVHEAVAVEAGGIPGTIATVVKTGVRLADETLVRPASVVVATDGGGSGEPGTDGVDLSGDA